MVLALPLQGRAAAPSKYLVVPVVGHTVPPAVVRSVDTQLQDALEAVMPGRLAKRPKKAVPCTTLRCFVDQGTAAGAQEVIIGEVLRIGSKLGVTLHLVHVTTAELAKHTAETVVPPNEAALKQALQAAIRDLLTLQPAPPSAQLDEPMKLEATAAPAHADIMQVTFVAPMPQDIYDVSLELPNGQMHCEREVTAGTPCVLRFEPSYAHLLVLRHRDDAFFSRVNRAFSAAGTEERYPFISRKLPSNKGDYRYTLQQNETALGWMTAGGVIGIAAGATTVALGAADIVFCPRDGAGAQLVCQIGVPGAIGTAALTVVGVAAFFIAREFLEGAFLAEESDASEGP